MYVSNLPDQPNRLGTRSVCPVVWEGVAVRLLPIPIALAVGIFPMTDLNDPNCQFFVVN